MRGIRSLWELISLVLVVVAASLLWIFVLLYLQATIDDSGLWILVIGMLVGAGLVGALVRFMRERGRSLTQNDPAVAPNPGDE